MRPNYLETMEQLQIDQMLEENGYIDEPIDIEKYRNLGIDTAICPELVAAIKMSRILSIPASTKASFGCGLTTSAKSLTVLMK